MFQKVGYFHFSIKCVYVFREKTTFAIYEKKQQQNNALYQVLLEAQMGSTLITVSVLRSCS